MLTCGGGGMKHKSSSELGHDQDFRKKACAQIDQGIAKIITSVDVVHFLIIFSFWVISFMTSHINPLMQYPDVYTDVYPYICDIKIESVVNNSKKLNVIKY